MQILFFIYDLGVGGAEKNTIKLSNYLASKGFKVSILTVSELNLLQDRINKEIELHSLNSKKLFGSFKKIYTFLRNNPIDILFVNVWPLTSITILAGLFLKIHIIPIEHGILSKEFKPKGRLFCWLQNISIFFTYNLFSSRIITVSNAAKKDLVDKGVFKKKISVIYNSFDTRADVNQAIDHPEWFEHSGPKLITVANLKAEKNLFNLLHAFKHIHKANKYSPRLLIIGSGPQERELKQLSKDLNIDSDVVFAGLKIDPYPYIEKSDIFILSSDFEAFGIVILEAMSLGKTIVSTNSEGPREIINHPSFGYLCRVNDSHDLADKIITGLEEPLEKHVIISRSEDFSIEKIGLLYKNLIEEIAN